VVFGHPMITVACGDGFGMGKIIRGVVKLCTGVSN
jgi:hypothetical protein